MRIRKPSDDDVPASEIVLLVVFLGLIAILVAWGLGLV